MKELDSIRQVFIAFHLEYNSKLNRRSINRKCKRLLWTLLQIQAFTGIDISREVDEIGAKGEYY